MKPLKKLFIFLPLIFVIEIGFAQTKRYGDPICGERPIIRTEVCSGNTIKLSIHDPKPEYTYRWYQVTIIKFQNFGEQVPDEYVYSGGATGNTYSFN